MFFGKGSSVLIPGFDSFLLRDANSTVSIEMRHSNSFTHEPLWAVTHTACSHSNRSHTDMLLIPLEKSHSSRDLVCKAKESDLIDLAMTLEPHGLNRRDQLL